MKIFKTVDAIQHYLQNDKTQKIGFVPTMGALHKGHLSLVEKAIEISDICVSSIYVNPTQFNEEEDLENYPRTFENDVLKLIDYRNDVLFYPSDKEIYPEGFEAPVDIDLKHLGNTMEGKYRPGHFEGMLNVVHRFLKIIEPDFLFMGQKDIQQAKIVEMMIRQLNLNVDLILGPIVREIDGLAMSSRNKRLKAEIRDKATILHNTLLWAAENIGEIPLATIEEVAMNRLSIPDFKPEYFKIVNAESLHSVEEYREDQSLVACTAVWADKIRLIDNKFL